MAACREPSSLIALRLGILLFTTGQLNCNTQKYRSLIGFWKMKLPVADTGYKKKGRKPKELGSFRRVQVEGKNSI